MASFVDEIPQFREYVAQQPIEAMVQVGMQKQAQYNEGIQKIQAQIDNVAGMDVVRDVDKQYLQSKLNSLGTKLKTVAAGDFSNFQLVNSVGGMVNQIARDKVVQNAVGSTQHYKKQIEKLQKDREEGKSDPANEYYFQKQAQAWLNSPKAGESFNGEYVPYFDVFKFAKETFDSVKPDGYSFDQVYVTDANGNPKMENGKPVFSPMMSRLDKEGIFPEKVRQTLDQIFSDPRVDRQLSISGEYNFRGYSPELLSNKIINQKQRLTTLLNERLNALQLDKNTGKDVQEELDAVRLQLENVTTQYDEYAQLAQNNPDAIRAALYKDQVRSNYSTMFGWSKTKESIHSNPGWDAMFRMNQEANRITQWETEMRFKMDNEAWERNYKLTNLALKERELINKYGSANLMEQNFQSTDEQQYVQQFDDTLEYAIKNYEAQSNELVYNLVLNKPENQEKFEQYKRAGNTDQDAAGFVLRDEAISILRNNGIDEPTEEQINKTLVEQKTIWQTEAIAKLEKLDPKNTPTKVQLLKESFISAKQEYDNALHMKNEYEKNLGEKTLDILNKAQSLSKPTQITIEGVPVDISAEDMRDAVIYLKGKESVLGFLNPKEFRDQSKLAEARLRERGMDFLIDYVTAHRDAVLPGKFKEGPVTALVTTFTSRGGDVAKLGNLKQFNDIFRKAYSATSDEELQAAIKSKADVLKQIGFSVSPNLKGSILTGNAEHDRNVKQNLMRLIGVYQTQKQNLDPGFKNRADEMLSFLRKNENLALELQTSKDDISGTVTPRIVMYDNDGKVRGSLIVTTEEAANLTGKDVNTFYAPREVTMIENRINFNPNNRTSISDPSDVSTYSDGVADYLFTTDKGGDFPNLQGMNVQVKANIAKVKGKYIPYIYVYDGKIEKVVDLGAYNNLSEVLDKLKATNSSLVNSILKEK